MIETDTKLIAPCGMFCGICSAYLGSSRNIPKKKNKISHCIGCRPRNKQCAFLKKNCTSLLKGEVTFCYECRQYPCERLQHLDERYRKNYNHSPIENLDNIKSQGTAIFLEDINTRYKCPECGGRICVHNEICYDCKNTEIQ